jgi:ubiquinone biosynthesis accessory factor UbiJ
MITSTAEALLNRGLPRSPRACELIAELAGRSLAIEVQGLGEWVLASDGNGVTLRREAAPAADARLAGGALSLLGLLTSSSTTPRARADVHLSGDAQLADKFRELLRLLRPDVEEELALALGDVPAHELARFARGTLAWCTRAADTTLRNVAEYFAHERGDLVSRAEGSQLLAGVDALREQVDRLAARLELIAGHIEARRKT